MAYVKIVRKSRKNGGLKFTLKKGEFISYLFIIILVIFMSIPLVYLISSAFKPMNEIFIYPPRIFVRRPTLKNFYDLVITLDSTVVPFSRYIFNSLVTTVAAVAGSVLICSMGAFALEKYRLIWANIIFSVVIAGLMFSAHVTTIPNYLAVNSLGIVNTFWALILPKLAVPMNFFLMKQFISQISDTYLEAARIDGAKEFTIFYRIIMPMVKPAWVTVIVFSFVANWNDGFSGFVYITSQTLKTLPVILSTIGGGLGILSRLGANYAASLLTTLPTIILFVFMQSKVVNTMSYSGIKA